MELAWGIVVTLLALLAWGGQALSWLAPARAERLSLTDREDDVDPAFYADVRGEAAWDTFTLWTFVVAGILLIADHGTWPYWGLIGGGMYLYFAGRGIFARIVPMRRGQRIGAAQDVMAVFVFLAVWGVVAVVTIVGAVVALSGS